MSDFGIIKTVTAKWNTEQRKLSIAKLASILFFTYWLGGCASTSSNIQAEYDTNTEAKFPELSVFYDDPSQRLRQECLSFDAQSALHYCSENTVDTLYYWKAFEQSNMFDDVSFADKDAEFKVAISTVSLLNETAGDLTNAVVSGASLLLIPMTSESEVRAEVSLYWRDVKLKQFTYQLPHVNTVSLFSDHEKADKDFAASLVSHIIADFQQENVFSSSLIANVLESTDYANDVVFPETISEFEYAGQFAFFDPFLGVMATYLSPEYVNDKIDVFVYPIRSVDLNDSETLLKNEMANVQKEIEYVITKQEWEGLAFSEAQKVVLPHGDMMLDGIHFGGSYFSELGEESFTSVYLFKYKDKFIKFRASFPSQYIGPHIEAVLPKVTVPGESKFMAEARSQERARLQSEKE